MRTLLERCRAVLDVKHNPRALSIPGDPLPTLIADLDAAIAQQAEPVAAAYAMPGADAFTMACFEAAKVPAGTNLYAAPQPPAAEPEQRLAEMERSIDTKLANFGNPCKRDDDPELLALAGRALEAHESDPMPRHDHNWRTGEPAAPQAEMDAWSARQLGATQADREGLVKELMTIVQIDCVSGMRHVDWLHKIEAHARRMVGLL